MGVQNFEFQYSLEVSEKMNIFGVLEIMDFFLGGGGVGWGWGRGFIEESDDFGASSLCILGYFLKVKLLHYLQKKHSNFVLLAKIIFPCKKLVFKFCFLL